MIHLNSFLYHIVPFPVKIPPFYFHLNPCGDVTYAQPSWKEMHLTPCRVPISFDPAGANHRWEGMSESPRIHETSHCPGYNWRLLICIGGIPLRT